MVALVLGTAAALVWLVLTYGLPVAMVAGSVRPRLGDVNATWLIWVVGTQSLSMLAAELAAVTSFPGLRGDLPAVAVCMWAFGVILYLTLVTLVFLRLLLAQVSIDDLGPAYWITMGAAAISANAAAEILALHTPLVSALHAFMLGLAVLLWAFATAWIPLLTLLTLWRYGLSRRFRRYEPGLWAGVFPLGMYAVTSKTLGQSSGLGFMVSVAEASVWVAVVTWSAVLALMLATVAAALRGRRKRLGKPAMSTATAPHSQSGSPLSPRRR